MSNTTTFGEVSYESDLDSEAAKKRKEANKDLFLRLKEGENEVRIVTSPFQYLTHKYKKDENNPKDFGRKVGCSIMHGSCPICEKGSKAQQRWFYGVIDRSTGTYKVLDVSYAVFSQIRKLARNAKIGDPTKYDINIQVDKNAPSPAQYYTVQNLSKEALSATDQQIKDNADLDDLKRRCTPPEPAVVQKIIDKIDGVAPAADAKKGAAPTKNAPKAAAKVPTVTMADENEVSEEFPAYAGEEQA